MPESPPLLVVEDLKTHFYTRRGVVKAVDGVSFTLNAGETLALVGESGSGKSVTCLSLVRLVPEPAGRIVGGVLLAGEDLLRKSSTEMRRVRGKQIAMVLQGPMASLNPALTIGGQVAEVVQLHQGVHGATLRGRVLEALTRLRIPGAAARLRHYPHQLSGGTRQRAQSEKRCQEPFPQAPGVGAGPNIAVEPTPDRSSTRPISQVMSNSGVRLRMQPWTTTPLSSVDSFHESLYQVDRAIAAVLH